MAIVQVDLIGTPRARRGDVSVTLRSRQTWALLASLLLEPETVSREVLAARFWPRSPQGRKSLGMALVSLREAFGDACVLAERDTVRLSLECFATDFAAGGALRDAARAEPDPDKRLTLLYRAAALSRGRFLEGADTFECGDGFLRIWSERCVALVADVLTDLARTQEVRDEHSAAFETLVRALRLHPDNGGVARRLWDAAQKAGREKSARLLLAELGAEDFLASPRPKPDLPAPRLPPLSPALVHVYESLTVFAAAFPSHLAKNLDSHATPDVLAALVSSGYVGCEETTEGTWFVIPADARKATQARLPKERTRSLWRAYLRTLRRFSATKYYELYSISAHERRVMLGMYESHLAALMADIVRRKPIIERLEMVDTLLVFGFSTLAATTRAWVESAAENITLPEMTREAAVWTAGYISLENRDFAAASAWFARHITDASSRGNFDGHIIQLGILATTYHHAADYEAAMLCGREALRLAEALGEEKLLGYALFVFAEVTYSTGFPSEALAASTRCVQIRRKAELPLSLATALYQHGVVLHRCEDRDGAIRAFNETIPIFYGQGDRNGVADCLRQLAVLRCELGALGEAFAFALQAREIYERLDNRGSLAATDEVFGDLHRAQGDPEAARKQYAASLAYWESVSHPRWTARLRARLAILDP